MRGGVCGERGFLGYLVFGGLLALGYGLGLSVGTFIFLGGSLLVFCCWFLGMLVGLVWSWSCGGLGSNEWNIFDDRLFFMRASSPQTVPGTSQCVRMIRKEKVVFRSMSTIILCRSYDLEAPITFQHLEPNSSSSRWTKGRPRNVTQDVRLPGFDDFRSLRQSMCDQTRQGSLSASNI